MKSIFSRFHPVFLLLVSLLLAVSAVAEAGSKKPRKAKLKVVSYNLYLGADIFRVFDPPPCGTAQAVFDVHSIIQQTDFPTRAEAIADQIALQEPHVIGLQEVSKLLTGPPDSLTQSGIQWIVPPPDPNPVFTIKKNAMDVSYDFLQIIQDALAARGLHYKVAPGASTTNADVEFPAIDHIIQNGTCVFASQPMDVRLTDRDVVLVREDLEINLQTGKNFDFNLPIVLPAVAPWEGGFVEATFVAEYFRGWGAVNVTIKDQDFTVLNTHLEVGDDSEEPEPLLNQLQAAQALEIDYVLNPPEPAVALPRPVLVIGDINSTPYSPIADPRPAYFILTQLAGLTDVWDIQFKPPLDEGFTCCQNEYVDNLESELHERIDVILADFGDLEEKLDKAKFELLGDQPADATPSGLWPSDPAGVAVKLEFDR